VRWLATSQLGATWWQYVVLFLAVTASWAGVPVIGSVAMGAAGVAASQGRLNLLAVIVVATAAGELGGLLGYAIGLRWGREIMEHPGARQASRQHLVEKGERAYARWGRLAVFFTPAIISGTARMRHGQFVIWNLLAAFLFAVAVGLSSYGLGRIATGHWSGLDFGALTLGLITGVGTTVVLHRRRRTRGRSLA